MNDIAILQEMLNTGAQVPLQQTEGKPSVMLKDKDGKTNVEIANLPDESIVFKSDYFKPPNIFMGTKGERRRADFVIVASGKTGKWIICIETQKATSKDAENVEQQLRGTQCLIGYCQCVGKSFWQSAKFLDGYRYRYVSIVNINVDKQTTRGYKPKSPSGKKIHDSPDAFREILGNETLYFDELT